MALTKTLTTHPDDAHLPEDQRRPYYDFRCPDDHEAVVVRTGPAQGPIRLSDGTVYDVTEDAVEVESHEHAAELNHHIGVQHEDRKVFPDDHNGVAWSHDDGSCAVCSPKRKSRKVVH